MQTTMKATTKRKRLTKDIVRQLLQRLAEDDNIAHHRKEFMIVIAVGTMTDEEYNTFENAIRKYHSPQTLYTHRQHIKRLQSHIEWLKNRL